MPTELEKYNISINILIDIINWHLNTDDECLCDELYRQYNESKIYKAIYFIEFNTNITIYTRLCV